MRFTVIRASFRLHPTLAAFAATAAGLLAVLSVAVAPARASSSCPNEIFRTGSGAGLPDCRAYEMVSPPQKNGGEVDGGPTFEGTPPAPQQVALDGEAVTYGSQTTFTEANPSSSPLTSQYLSQRGPSGWHTEAITPKQDIPGGVFDREDGSVEFSPFQGFTEGLEHAFLLAYEPSPVPGAPAKFFNPYVRNNAAGSYDLLSTVTPPVAKPGLTDAFNGLLIEYAGMSADGSRVAFSADDKLTPGALPGEKNLYEWNHGRLELVSVLPDGSAVEGAVFGAFTIDQGGLNEDYQRVVSADGSRVFWTGPEAQLYMRELTGAGARTVQVSASQKTNGSGPGGSDPAGPQPARYMTASVDGSRVFFTSCEQLTNDSTARQLIFAAEYLTCGALRQTAESERVGEDLYMYEPGGAGGPRLTDISPDPNDNQTASVMGVLGASEDGSYIYFVAHGALTAGAPSGLDVYNVYLWHNGSISLVTTTGPEDYAISDGGNPDSVESFLQSEYLLEHNTVRVSADGRYLTFESTEPLTGYENKPVQPEACQSLTSFWAHSANLDDTGRCIEVYDYDADSGRLTCASCNATGLPPVGDSIEPMALHSVSRRAGWQSSTSQQRYLLDDGRLFFDSTDALLPQASDGKMNVYEYEPAGLGSCQGEDGCLALISSGTSSENSFFLGASASGDDVFFITRQQLVAADGDEALDVYDARVDGGFAPATPPPCGGEACRAPVAPAPAIYGAPPSATFAGAGNPPQTAAPVKPKTKKATAKAKTKRKHKRKAARRAKRQGARRSLAQRLSRGSHR